MKAPRGGLEPRPRCYGLKMVNDSCLSPMVATATVLTVKRRSRTEWPFCQAGIDTPAMAFRVIDANSSQFISCVTNLQALGGIRPGSGYTGQRCVSGRRKIPGVRQQRVLCCWRQPGIAGGVDLELQMYRNWKAVPALSSYGDSGRWLLTVQPLRITTEFVVLQFH